MALLYELLTKVRKEGLMSIEADVESPENSPLFTKYPTILADHHVIEFMTDYLRLMVSGNMNAFEIENLMDNEIETHHHEGEVPVHVRRQAGRRHARIRHRGGGDGRGAHHGIGRHSAGRTGHPDRARAGRAPSSASCWPMASSVRWPACWNRSCTSPPRCFSAIKVTLLASLNGYAPAIAVEFGRKVLFSTERPSFSELEDHVKSAKNRAEVREPDAQATP